MFQYLLSGSFDYINVIKLRTISIQAVIIIISCLRL